MRLWVICLLAAGIAKGEVIRGAALLEHPRARIVTWGDRLLEWNLDGAPPNILRIHADYGPGGCAADVDGDGWDDLLVQERPGPGRMLWLSPPSWGAQTAEAETDFADCLPFTIEGRRGVVMTHLYAQPRFYLFPHFDYKELYSIYTASEQGGLLSHDVDGDGLPDLFIGNYWMRNPGRLDVAWRLFAVNAFHNTPQAARAALAVWKGRTLFWAESLAAQARIVAFSPPQDVKQLWIEHRLEPLDQPRALLAVDAGVLIGHAGGVVLESPQGEGWKRTQMAAGFAVLKLFEVNGAVWAVTPTDVRRVYLRK